MAPRKVRARPFASGSRAETLSSLTQRKSRAGENRALKCLLGSRVERSVYQVRMHCLAWTREGCPTGSACSVHCAFDLMAAG